MEHVEALLEENFKASAPSGTEANHHDRRSEDRSPDSKSAGRRRHRSRSRSRSRERSEGGRSHRSSRKEREGSFQGSADGRSEGGRSRGARRDDRDRDRDYRDRRRDDRDDRRRSYRDDRNDRDRRRDAPRRRSRSRSPPPRARSPPPPPRERSPQLTEEEHEMRSVFVSQLSARVADRELTQFFEAHAGKVRDAKVIVDRISRRSKGVGYVEFKELESVNKALALTGTKLLGIPVVVQYTEAERNRQAQNNAPAAENANIVIFPGSDAKPNAPIPYNRLYIGSLNFNLTDADVRQVFQPFGHVDVVDLHRDQLTGKSKGYCFVQFRFHADAVQALEKMNNFPLAGRPIKCGLVTEKMTLMARNDNNAGGSLEENTGGTLSGISRIELMQKLARQDPRPTEQPMVPMWKPNIPSAKSKCVLLKNMFDPREETEPHWDTELRDDVKQECMGKYGQVRDIYVLKDSEEGDIYIKFDTEVTAERAINGLNGRFFGGKQVAAQFTPDAIFEARKSGKM